ncbi:MAG: hypothetical protein HY335_07645, partial [Deinococcus sp.]|nr:hypothetical protein [Deinococcus sp.]
LELRREVYNHTGTLVEVREFVALTYQVSEADRALVARLSASPPLVDQSLRFFTLAEASATSGLALRLPAQLPHGFRFVGVMQPEGNLAHLVFTDGLHTMSLYEERVPWWAFWAWPAPPTLISQQRISHRMRFTLVCNLGAHQMRVLLDSLP